MCAYPGATVADVSAHALVELNSKHRKRPDIAIIHAGSNDLGKGNSVDTITDELALAVTQLRNVGLKNIALSGVTVRAGLQVEVDKLNKSIKEVCKNFQVSFIDNSNIKYKQHVSHDTVHLNAKGIEILERNLARWVNSFQVEKE